MTDPPVVLVVDGDAVCRESILRTLQSGGLRAIAFESASAFLAFEQRQLASCLILGISLSSADALGLQGQLAGTNHPPIVFVTGSIEVSSCVSAMKAGAVDYLSKPFAEAELLDAIHGAVARDKVARVQRALLSQLQQRYSQLTPREREVFSLVVAGLLNKQAGGELGISEITLKSHRGKVMQKMAASSFADLVRMGEQLHITAQRTQRDPCKELSTSHSLDASVRRTSAPWSIGLCGSGAESPETKVSTTPSCNGFVPAVAL